MNIQTVMIYSSSETEETTLPELLTSLYDPMAINLSNEELKIRSTKRMKNIKMNLHKINLVI